MVRRDTLERLCAYVWKPLLRVERTYEEEGNWRHLHLRLMDVFKLFSPPSEKEVLLLKQRCERRGDGTGVEMLNKCSPNPTDFQRLKLQLRTNTRKFLPDLNAQEHAPEAKKLKLEDAPEAKVPPLALDQTKGAGLQLTDELGLQHRNKRMDIVCRVEKAPVMEDEKPQMTVSIAECNENRSEDPLFQNSGYGRIEVRHNIARGHYDAIYLPILTADKFTYAILDVDGLVDVCDNTISEVAYSEYQDHCAEKGATPKPLSDLQSRVAARCKELNLWDEYQPELPQKKYPNTKYLVGDLYIANEWYPLPTESVGYQNPEALLFMEGMLRTTLGDRVLNWSPEDLQAAYQKQNTLLEVAGRCAGAPQLEEEEDFSNLTDSQCRDKVNRLLLELRRRQ